MKNEKCNHNSCILGNHLIIKSLCNIVDSAESTSLRRGYIWPYLDYYIFAIAGNEVQARVVVLRISGERA